jgi:hypothetical protein
MVASFKHRLGNKWLTYRLGKHHLAFWLSKANNGYDYIQENYFPIQHYGKKMFLFKMSMDGNNNKCDLMK